MYSDKKCKRKHGINAKRLLDGMAKSMEGLSPEKWIVYFNV